MEKDKSITTDIDFRTAEVKGKWRSKEEMEKVKEIYDRFIEMKKGRESSCYWAEPQGYGKDLRDYEEEDGYTVLGGQSNETGTDWNTHWNRCYKLWSMWASYPADGTPNVKSPISFAPVEAALAEFKDNNVGVTLSPVEESDKGKVKIMQHAIKYLETHGDFGKAKASTLKETLITGTSFAYVCWISRKREVELLMNSKEIEKTIEEADIKKKEKMKKQLEKKKPFTKKETINEYNDVAYIPVSCYEVWMDPDARELHGLSHEAVDLIWRNLMSLDQSKAEYMNGGDPYLIEENFDKVVAAKKAGSSIGGTDHPFFDTPSDVDSDNQVEVIRYFNKVKDKYIILINDVLIRDGPLPYNHKQIPFVMHRAIKFPHRLYGMGLPTILESLQSEDESLRNMMLSQLHINIFPPIIANEGIFNDIDEAMDYPMPGKIISVSGETDSRNLRWFEGSQPRVEYAMMRNTIQEDAIKTSGINPLAYSVPKPNEPVRNNLLSLESTLKMLKKMFKNWAEGQKDAVRQEIAIMKQLYTKDKVIKLEGLEMEEKEGELLESQIDNYSFFKLKPKYFDLKGDPDIEIDIDTLVPMSQGLKMQKIEQAMQQLLPILANPMMLQAPGVSQLVREYVEVHQLSPKLLEMIKDETTDEELEKADEQEKLMKQGFEVSGIPGESDGHKLHHLQAYLQWKQELEDKQDKLWEEPQVVEPNMYGVVEVGKPQDTDDIKDLRDVIEKLAKHMVTDHQQKETGIQSPPTPTQQALGQLGPMGAQGMMDGAPPMGPSPMGAPPMGAEGMMPPGGRMGPEGMMGPQGGITGTPPMGPPMV